MAQAAEKKVNGHPSGDDRFKAIDLTMKRFKYEKDALLEVLNTAQETFGYLSEDLLIYVSNHLGVPLSQVYGVSTFYHMFTFEPLGEHNCIICAGTACHVKGGEKVIEALSAEYDLEPGETTPDGMFSLTIARCIGSCGLSPVIVLDGKVMAKQTPDLALREVDTVLSAARAAKQEASV
jgi:bidirectional [NiFe] hydrogenase diaphorase subunit